MAEDLADRKRGAGREGSPPFARPSPCPAAASSTDPATWSSFAEVVAAVAGFDGIGFVFSADDPYTGIDLDNCLAGERMDPQAAAIVIALDSFTEISPSATGVKLIVRASKN